MTQCYIGLGSNLSNATGDSVAILRQAVKQLSLVGRVQVSKLYHTPPMGPQDQPDYWNAVVALNTALSPLALLDYLQVCEQKAGRVRLRHWGERTLDLDLLIYGMQKIQNARLSVPHKGMLERDFVLLPLLDLSPDLVQLKQLFGEDMTQLDTITQSTLSPYADENWVQHNNVA